MPGRIFLFIIIILIVIEVSMVQTAIETYSCAATSSGACTKENSSDQYDY
jgi:hypothetical protein